MKQTVPVLIIDDEATIRQVLADALTKAGHETTSAVDGTEALRIARERDFAVALIDLSMPGLSGMDTVRGMKEIRPDTEVIIITGQGSLDSSIEALREEVFDYLCKPIDLSGLVRSVVRAFERRELVLENRRLMRELQSDRKNLQRKVATLERGTAASATLVGESGAIRTVRQFIAEVAPTDITVLLRGESGTGKDVVARLIHESSGRGNMGNFVKINCPAIPETLLESELFGHEAGAFTGADRRKPGRFELAAGGTLFLDEIGEIPTAIQVKLLQAIEHKQFARLGGNKTIATDARIVAATNALLESMIASGRFRSDLFYRLNQYSIVLPPLRERREDIPLLVQHFLALHGSQHGRPDLSLSPSAMATLVSHDWAGNVRQLEAVMRRYVLTGREASINEGLDQSTAAQSDPDQRDRLKESEIRTILGALTQARWNQRRAAQLLGISYSALRRRIQKYNLKNRWLEQAKSEPSKPVSRAV